MLDFDGTLAPFAPTPDAARLEPTAASALDRLLAEASPGLRIGVASGRTIEDLRRLLPPLHVWIGLHGLEVAIADEPHRLRFDPLRSDRALERLRPRLDAAIGAGGRIEDKVHSIALHVRGLEPARAATAIAAFVREVEREREDGAPLECLSGHMVVEARPLGAGKHRAIDEVLRGARRRRSGFRRRRRHRRGRVPRVPRPAHRRGDGTRRARARPPTICARRERRPPC